MFAQTLLPANGIDQKLNSLVNIIITATRLLFLNKKYIMCVNNLQQC